jgi:hypothetical protein
VPIVRHRHFDDAHDDATTMFAPWQSPEKGVCCGIVEIRSFFNEEELSELKNDISKISAFSEQPSEDEGFEFHPGYIEMPEYIKKKLISKLEGTNLKKFYPSIGSVSRAVIAEYCASNKTSMDYHRDISLDEFETISVIISVSDVTASVQMSSQHDGSYNGEQRQLLYYPVHNNSVYAFVGSYATHGVVSLSSDVKEHKRYAFVLFFRSRVTRLMASVLWQLGFDHSGDVLMCHQCLRIYKSKRTLMRHICKR